MIQVLGATASMRDSRRASAMPSSEALKMSVAIALEN